VVIESPTPEADAFHAEDVSVIVPARGAGSTLKQCLRALTTAVPRASEVVVVLDGADSELRSIVEAFAFKTVELSTPHGAAAARNAGVEVTRGKVLMFVDADVVIAPNAVGEAIVALNDDPSCAAVFGSYDDEPGATNFVAQYKGLLNHFVHQSASADAGTFWTALGAVRRDAFNAVDGLDVAQRLEDIALGYRLRAAGYRICLRHTMLAKHLKRWTALSLLRSDFYDRALPWTRLMLQYRSAAADLNLDWTNRLSLLCVAGLCATAAFALKAPIYAAMVAGCLVIAMLWLNRRLYGFFLRKRGFSFLCLAIIWHGLYFLCGGLAFVCGVIQHLFLSETRRVPHAAEALREARA
jgi:glycosyltransferase involved in cell wall biosynthesis